MHIICTKYIGATETKPDRIRVSASGWKTKIYSYHTFDYNPHYSAAVKFAREVQGIEPTLETAVLPESMNPEGECYVVLNYSLIRG